MLNFLDKLNAIFNGRAPAEVDVEAVAANLLEIDERLAIRLAEEIARQVIR